jgi:hypothetical protein
MTRCQAGVTLSLVMFHCTNSDLYYVCCTSQNQNEKKKNAINLLCSNKIPIHAAIVKLGTLCSRIINLWAILQRYNFIYSLEITQKKIIRKRGFYKGMRA